MRRGMTNERLRREGFLFLAGFALCIPAANWLIGHAGTACIPLNASRY